MKKILAFLLVFGLCGAALFAQGFSLSAGAGGMFDALFSSTKMGDADPSKTNLVGGGLYAFFDATYAEVDLDLLFSSQSNPDAKDSGSMALTYFGFSVLGKYPIALNEQVSLFPLLGIDYQAFLSGQMKDKDGKDIEGIDPINSADKMGDNTAGETFSLFSIAVGVGADFSLTEQLYLRGEFLWNFKLDSAPEADARKKMKDANVDYSSFTSGPRIKLAVGFKF
jgi:opacity protein-like surface antigen